MRPLHGNNNIWGSFRESAFVDAQIALHGLSYIKSHAHGYRYVMRFIDDRAAAGILDSSLLPTASDYDGVELTLAGSSDSGPLCLLGYEVSFHDGCYQFGIYNKQQKFGFPLPRYPHYGGGLPQKSYIGLIVGAITRAYRLCTMRQYLEYALFDLAQVFLLREYPSSIVIKAVDIFIRRHCHHTHSSEVKRLCFSVFAGAPFVVLEMPLFPALAAAAADDDSTPSFKSFASSFAEPTPPPAASGAPSGSLLSAVPSTSSQGLLNFFPSVPLSERLPRRSSMRDSLPSTLGE